MCDYLSFETMDQMNDKTTRETTSGNVNHISLSEKQYLPPANTHTNTETDTETPVHQENNPSAASHADNIGVVSRKSPGEIDKSRNDMYCEQLLEILQTDGECDAESSITGSQFAQQVLREVLPGPSNMGDIVSFGMETNIDTDLSHRILSASTLDLLSRARSCGRRLTVTAMKCAFDSCDTHHLGTGIYCQEHADPAARMSITDGFSASSRMGAAFSSSSSSASSSSSCAPPPLLPTPSQRGSSNHTDSMPRSSAPVGGKTSGARKPDKLMVIKQKLTEDIFWKGPYKDIFDERVSSDTIFNVKATIMRERTLKEAMSLDKERHASAFTESLQDEGFSLLPSIDVASEWLEIFSETEINQLGAQFNRLDTNHNGRIDLEDVTALVILIDPTLQTSMTGDAFMEKCETILEEALQALCFHSVDAREESNVAPDSASSSNTDVREESNVAPDSASSSTTDVRESNVAPDSASSSNTDVRESNVAPDSASSSTTDAISAADISSTAAIVTTDLMLTHANTSFNSPIAHSCTTTTTTTIPVPVLPPDGGTESKRRSSLKQGPASSKSFRDARGLSFVQYLQGVVAVRAEFAEATDKGSLFTSRASIDGGAIAGGAHLVTHVDLMKRSAFWDLRSAVLTIPTRSMGTVLLKRGYLMVPESLNSWKPRHARIRFPTADSAVNERDFDEKTVKSKTNDHNSSSRGSSAAVSPAVGDNGGLASGLQRRRLEFCIVDPKLSTSGDDAAVGRGSIDALFDGNVTVGSFDMPSVKHRFHSSSDKRSIAATKVLHRHLDGETVEAEATTTTTDTEKSEHKETGGELANDETTGATKVVSAQQISIERNDNEVINADADAAGGGGGGVGMTADGGDGYGYDNDIEVEPNEEGWSLHSGEVSFSHFDHNNEGRRSTDQSYSSGHSAARNNSQSVVRMAYNAGGSSLFVKHTIALEDIVNVDFAFQSKVRYDAAAEKEVALEASQKAAFVEKAVVPFQITLKNGPRYTLAADSKTAVNWVAELNWHCAANRLAHEWRSIWGTRRMCQVTIRDWLNAAAVIAKIDTSKRLVREYENEPEDSPKKKQLRVVMRDYVLQDADREVLRICGIRSQDSLEDAGGSILKGIRLIYSTENSLHVADGKLTGGFVSFAMRGLITTTLPWKYARAAKNRYNENKYGAKCDSKAAAVRCACCSELFKGFAVRVHLRKYHCRSCGRVVCHGCSANKVYMEHIDSHERVCTICLQNGKPQANRLLLSPLNTVCKTPAAAAASESKAVTCEQTQELHQEEQQLQEKQTNSHSTL